MERSEIPVCHLHKPSRLSCAGRGTWRRLTSYEQETNDIRYPNIRHCSQWDDGLCSGADGRHARGANANAHQDATSDLYGDAFANGHSDTNQHTFAADGHPDGYSDIHTFANGHTDRYEYSSTASADGHAHTGAAN